jgi:ATP adenylyltransferase
MTYVAAAGPSPSSSSAAGTCLFCRVFEARDDRRTLILQRGSQAFLILNAYPYASGHLMAVPVRHVAGLEDTRDDEMTETIALLRRGVQALQAAYRPDGFNVGLNQGRAAGAGVAGHLHFHVVPRWHGDTNFMPVIGETKVLPESLESTYERLLAALHA